MEPATLAKPPKLTLPDRASRPSTAIQAEAPAPEPARICGERFRTKTVNQETGKLSIHVEGMQRYKVRANRPVGINWPWEYILAATSEEAEAVYRKRIMEDEDFAMQMDLRRTKAEEIRVFVKLLED